MNSRWRTALLRVSVFLCVSRIYINLSTGFCENCKASKCELQKTHEELKSAELMTDLLVKEINFTKASTGASINRYQCIYTNNDPDFSSDERNGARINNWMPVRNSHSGNIRRKNTQHSDILITPIVLKFWVTPMNHLTRQPRTSRRYIKPCVCREIDLTLQRNTLFC